MLLIPPSLALIFRHKFKRACGLNLGMFLACTHCVAIPSAVSPTLLISAVETIQTIRHVFHFFMFNVQEDEGIGFAFEKSLVYFRVAICLCFKTSLQSKPFTSITQRPFWSPWGIKALSSHSLCPSSLTLNERFDGQNLLFGH